MKPSIGSLWSTADGLMISAAAAIGLKRRGDSRWPCRRFLAICDLAIWSTGSTGHATPCIAPSVDLSAASGAEYWSSQERWVWAMAQAGEIADLNARYGECDPLDPNEDDRRWIDPAHPRLLTERFLLDVFGKSEYAAAVGPRGLRIVGARFASAIDLAGVDVAHPVWIEQSRFEGPLKLAGANFAQGLSFYGSNFDGRLNLRSVSIGRDLVFDAANLESSASFRSSTIGGTLFADETKFAALDMENVDATKSILLRDATFMGDVRLYGATTRALEADRATFHARLDLKKLEAKQHVFLRDGSFAGDVHLFEARTRALEIDGSTFRVELNMMHLHTEQLISFANATFEDDVLLIGAKTHLFRADRSTFKARLDMEGFVTEQTVLLRDATLVGDDGFTELRHVLSMSEVRSSTLRLTWKNLRPLKEYIFRMESFWIG